MECLTAKFRRGAFWLWCLSWCLTMTHGLSAQSYSFKHYGHDEGLTTTVNRLLQDRQGFLWVGTANGLFRYDGQRFQRFGLADGLPSVGIRDIHESSDGTLWIVTSGGLARLDHNRFESIKTADVDGLEGVFDIVSDARGRFYVSSKNGLLMAEPAPSGRSRDDLHFSLVNGVPRGPVQGAHLEPDGSLWFGCGRHLCLLENGRTQGLGPAEVAS